mgnify:CR=1 FL=1
MTPTRLAAVLLAALLVLAPVADASKFKVIDAVKPLSIEGYSVNTQTGEVEHINICTTASINKNASEKGNGGYWLTAAHCVEEPEITYWIAGQKAPVVMRDVLNDLAILWTEKPAKVALKLANKWPEFGDKIYMAGHPFGYGAMFFTQGFVANPSGYLENWMSYRPFMLLDVAGAPGSSGSPVTNDKQEIISVLQIGWGDRRGFSPVLGGATLGAVRNYKNYFGK